MVPRKNAAFVTADLPEAIQENDRLFTDRTDTRNDKFGFISNFFAIKKDCNQSDRNQHENGKNDNIHRNKFSTDSECKDGH